MRPGHIVKTIYYEGELPLSQPKNRYCLPAFSSLSSQKPRHGALVSEDSRLKINRLKNSRDASSKHRRERVRFSFLRGKLNRFSTRQDAEC